MKYFSENLYNFFYNFFEINAINSYFYEISSISLTNNELYLDKQWLYFSNIISVILISFFIILLGIIFPNKAKIIKFLNLISAFYLLIFTYLMTSEYLYHNTYATFFTGHTCLTYQLNYLFQQNHSLYVNFFLLLATLTTLIFFLSICDVFYLEENMKIEYTLLVFYVYLSAILLLSSLDFISIIILLECIAFSSYVLVGFERKNKFSTSSALKYLILAAVPSGFFILGISILYNNYGSFYQDYLDILIVTFENNVETSIKEWQKIVKYSLYNTFEKDFCSEIIQEHMFYQDAGGHYYTSLVNFILNQNTLLFVVLALTKMENYIQFFFDKGKFAELSELKELYFIYYTWFTFLMETFYRYNEYTEVTQVLQSFSTEELYPTDVERFLSNREKKVQIFHMFLDRFSPKESNGFDKFLGFLSYYKYITELDNPGYSPYGYKKTSLNLTYTTKIQKINAHFLWETSNFMPVDKLHYWEYFNDKLEDVYDSINGFTKFLFEQSNFVEFNEKNAKKWDGPSNYRYYELLHKVFFNNQQGHFPSFARYYIESANFQKVPTTFFFELNYDNIFLSTYLVIVFLIINLSFKITAAPFHFWAPSVYGGSPLPTITFLSVFSKLTIIFLFINLFLTVFEHLKAIWQPILFFLGVFSIIISIIGAFSEKVFKRFFIYSSIGHVGFMVLGLAVINYNGIQGAIDYLILYVISSLIVWFIVMHLTKKTTHLISFKGLAFNSPALSLILVIALFSISGLPPMGGFFVKFEIFYSLINSSQYFIAYFLFLLTVFSFFYYLRLIKIIYFEDNKTIKKNKNLNDIKLRLISILIFILPLYVLYYQQSFFFILKQYIIKSI